MLKQFSFISMGSSHVVTEYESKTVVAQHCPMFYYAFSNVLGLHSPTSTAGAAGRHLVPSDPLVKGTKRRQPWDPEICPEKGMWGGVLGAEKPSSQEGRQRKRLQQLRLSTGHCCCLVPVTLPAHLVPCRGTGPFLTPVILPLLLTFLNPRSITAKWAGRASSMGCRDKAWVRSVGSGSSRKERHLLCLK